MEEKPKKFDEYYYLFRYSPIKKKEADAIWPDFKKSVKNLCQARELFFATRKIFDSKREEAWEIVRKFAKEADLMELFSIFSAIHAKPERNEVWQWIKEKAISSNKLLLLYEFIKTEDIKKREETFELLVEEVEGVENLLWLFQKMDPDCPRELPWDVLQKKITTVNDCAKVLSLRTFIYERSDILRVAKKIIKNPEDLKVLFSKKGALRFTEKNRLTAYIGDCNSQEDVENLWSFAFEGGPLPTLTNLRKNIS